MWKLLALSFISEHTSSQTGVKVQHSILSLFKLLCTALHKYSFLFNVNLNISIQHFLLLLVVQEDKKPTKSQNYGDDFFKIIFVKSHKYCVQAGYDIAGLYNFIGSFIILAYVLSINLVIIRERFDFFLQQIRIPFNKIILFLKHGTFCFSQLTTIR